LTFVPPRIEVNVPAVDITAAATSPRDFGARPLGADGSAAGEETNIGGSKGPFLPEQVEEQAALAPGNAPPRYPEALRSAGVEGKVIAVFTVEETGRAEPESIRFVSSDNQLFEEAVRVALGRMRFVPAEVRGRKVRQLVQMPFVFTLGR
jgi:protein TonB